MIPYSLAQFKEGQECRGRDSSKATGGVGSRFSIVFSTVACILRELAYGFLGKVSIFEHWPPRSLSSDWLCAPCRDSAAKTLRRLLSQS